MSAINFYEFAPKGKKVINPGFRLHGIEVPFRACIASASGTGKTNALMNLLVHMSGTFHEIILCVKSADEPLYEMIIDKLPNIVVFEQGEVPPLSDYSSIDPKTKRLKRIDEKQRLIVFDDLVSDPKANTLAAQYYIKGRKLGFSSVYISQSFFEVPKLIRDNCNIFILGRNLLKQDLKLILSRFPTELTLDEFSELYAELTANPLDTMLINLNTRTIRQNIIGAPIEL